MTLVETAGRPADGGQAIRIAEEARLALAHERAGRFREAWRQWERLRDLNPARSDWNAPLAASYLRYAFSWTSDCGEGALAEVEAALLRGMSILTIDLAHGVDDVARLMLIARACEQRCILRAFGEGWTSAARDDLDAGKAALVTGDERQILAAGVAATAAFDLVALCAPSLAPLAGELAQSCLRLAVTLQAAGADQQARELELRAETVLLGPGRHERRPTLVAIEGDANTTPARRPSLRLVTSRTA
ncbi:hypothetical protein [Hansschlegelia zhihuaiae]|uniref:Uncharacterized protein n=1 Tax=Hansschlegelia zhihuaiae TaxID=405005 RepID=A0A4Q0MJA4_9HYPH|nr:hypothetical protein [Hansschlegelia zhihuaiae]RXF73787.1 hypothetical protein EK403_09390 [Hansschlegelia zhihuaiae]